MPRGIDSNPRPHRSPNCTQVSIPRQKQEERKTTDQLPVGLQQPDGFCRPLFIARDLLRRCRWASPTKSVAEAPRFPRCHWPSLVPERERIVWENVVEVPGLQFGTREVTFSAEHVMKCSVEECEHVKIFAPEAMRKCFLGIYEIEAS